MACAVNKQSLPENQLDTFSTPAQTLVQVNSAYQDWSRSQPPLQDSEPANLGLKDQWSCQKDLTVT